MKRFTLFTLVALLGLLGSMGSLFAQPTTAAPVPTRDAANVISLFSDTYTNVSGIDWFPGWGQSTQASDISVAGNTTRKYASLNYQGVQFATAVDASTMTHLHFDIWATTCTEFRTFLINLGPTVERTVNTTPTIGGWLSVDIPLSQYNSQGINLASIGQMKFEGTPWGTSEVYLDNIYFWKPANAPTITGFSVPAKVMGDPVFNLTAPTSNSGGAFTYTSSNTAVATISGSTVTIVGVGSSIITATQAAAGGYSEGSTTATLVVTPNAAPVPTRDAANVISLFSDTYTNVSGTDWFPNWGQSTIASDISISGNATRRYANLNYQGVQFAGTVNASSMTHLHLDIWTANCTSFKVFLINAGPVEKSFNITPTLSSWTSVDIDLSQYTSGSPSINLSSIIQFKFEGLPSGSSEVYLDNIYFWKPANAPTITGFSVPAKVMGDAPFTLTAPTSNSAGAFTYTSSNTAVATISGTTVTIVGVGSSTITANQAAAGGYSAGTTSATLVVTSPGPTAAAPTPTRTASNVSSLFSEAYSNAYTSMNWNPGWGQATVYSEVTIAGNAAKKYENLNYQGAEPSPVINLTSRTHLHFDAWTPSATTFRVKLVDFGANGTFGGGDDSEHEVVIPLIGGSWESKDIALADFTGMTARANFAQFIISSPSSPSPTVWLDNIYFYNNTSLPVELVSFKVKAAENKAILTWQTATETDNEGFTIERSTNGTQFAPIGQVKGFGTTNVINTYVFTDEKPTMGVNYYRLRQRDFNGKESFSATVSAIFAKSSLTIRNTLVNNILELTISEDIMIPLSIFNIAGQQVYTAKLQGNQRIDVSALPAGMYFVQAGLGEVVKFVKQ